MIILIKRIHILQISLKTLLLFCIISSCSSEKQSITVNNELINAPVKYAINKLSSLENVDGNWKISTQLDTLLGAEAFEVAANGKVVKVTGGDAVGVMYGLLYIKEQLEQGKSDIPKTKESPHYPFRAIKFNLPWDSYREGESLALHTETCRDTVFWQSFLDMMAENRFNKLTLWNLHPFNYLVKTQKYPEACGFSDEEMQNWERFWTSLFRMAKERGIETYLVNWNIFVSPEFAKAHNVAQYCVENKYNVKIGDTSEIIKDYTRECVREVIDKYPDLTGLGITLGEGMGGMTADEREEWLLDSFIEGMRQASRKVKFIHRAPLSAGKGSGGSTSSYVEKMTRRTLDTLSCIEGKITIELKYNWSHAHSCPQLVKVHGGELTDAYWNPLPENYKLAWMMRNEDFFVLRWGQPEFIREHIALNSQEYISGYFVGSETYIPAKDYITVLPNTSYAYAFERQWMFYKLWGRLLYNPETSDAVFTGAFNNRFPQLGEKLFKAQSQVSRIPLMIASYWNATWDYTLYSEGFLSSMGNRGKMKLLSLEQMCNKRPMNPSYLSIREFLSNNSMNVEGKISPPELADSMDSFCSNALLEIGNIDYSGNNDLRYELADIKAWANLGMYFSHKLRAANEYQQFLNSADKEHYFKSLQWLKKATDYWHNLVEVTQPVYEPVPLQHYEKNDNNYFHWAEIETEVLEELRWLKSIGDSL
jgi:hypothetical protein